MPNRPRLALLSILLLSIVAAGCGARTVVTVPPPTPSPSGNADFVLDWAWQQSVANSPLCTASVTTSCVKSFTWGYSVSGAQTPVKTTSLPYSACPAQIPNPADLSCQTAANGAGIVQFYDTANSLLPLGGTGSTPYVVTNWVDMNGNAQATSPATAPNIIESAPAATITSATAHQ